MIYFIGDLESKIKSKDAARRLLRLGKTVAGCRCISEEDIQKEYEIAPSNIKANVLEDSCAVRQNRMEEDSQTPKRSAKESLGVGSKPKRGRRGLEKQSFEVIEGGANRLDVQEVR